MINSGSRPGRYRAFWCSCSLRRGETRGARDIRLCGDSDAGHELEPRICLSSLYSFDAIASQVQILQSEMGTGPSINDAGTVADAGKFATRVDELLLRDSQASPTDFNASEGNTSRPKEGDPDFVGPLPPEYDNASAPAEVSGAFLTGGAEMSTGNDKPMSFAEVVQGDSDTCVFSSVISAVALTDFDLASGVTIASKKSATDYVYSMPLFTSQTPWGLQGGPYPRRVRWNS